MVLAQEQTNIKEYQLHKFSGAFPDVSTYPFVDMELLIQGDTDPFFVTLAIAEIGKTSQNGLLYDKSLVEAIAEQLAGSGGIRGHIPEGEETTSFPVDAVDWVGHVLKEGKLWAKGYIPPGDTRDHIRRIRARSGSLGTSIYGYGVTETVNEKTWRLSGFDLHSVDLAPAKMASLQMGGQFRITKETIGLIKETETMPVVSIDDVPSEIRAKIIEAAKLEADMQRVGELRTQVNDALERVTEMERVIEAKTTRIAELEDQVTQQATVIREYENAQFELLIGNKIAELTNWVVTTDESKARLAKVREMLRTSAIVNIGTQERKKTVIELALDKAWEDNKIILETVRDSLAGPSAAIQSSKPSGNQWDNYKTPEGIEQLKSKWGL